MISVWPFIFLGEWGERVKFLQVYLVLGVGVGRRSNRTMTILFEMSTPLPKTSDFTLNRCTYLRCRIINGFRLFVCYRVSRNRHFFFNFTRISNLIRDHKYWITLYCNKSRFFIFTIPFKPETSVWVSIKISN